MKVVVVGKYFFLKFNHIQIICNFVIFFIGFTSASKVTLVLFLYFSYDHNASIHTIGKSKAFQRDADRNSTLFLDHPSVHRHSFLATEV